MVGIVNWEDFLEEASLKQIFFLKRQGLGRGWGERIPRRLWPLLWSLALCTVLSCPFPHPPSSEYPEAFVYPGCLSLETLTLTLSHSHHPHVPFGSSRSQASSESEVDDEGPCGGDGDPGLFPFPLPRGGAQASSEESEEEGTSDDLHLPPDCHYATRPPRPQAVRRHRTGSWGGGWPSLVQRWPLYLRPS